MHGVQLLLQLRQRHPIARGLELAGVIPNAASTVVASAELMSPFGAEPLSATARAAPMGMHIRAIATTTSRRSMLDPSRSDSVRPESVPWGPYSR